MRVIIYEMKDGTEEIFPLYTVEDERHERAQAEREVRSRDTQVQGYRFEERSRYSEAVRNRLPGGRLSHL